MSEPSLPFAATPVPVAQGIAGGNASAFADVLPMILWISAPDGAVVYSNRAWAAYTGQRPNDAQASDAGAPDPVAADPQAFVHPEDLPAVRAAWTPHLPGGDAAGADFAYELRLRRSDGVYRWHQVRCIAQRDDAGAIARWVGVAADIDDQKQGGLERARLLAKSEVDREALVVANAQLEAQFHEAERVRASLSASERQLHTLADAIPTLAWTARGDGYIEWYNARWYEYTATTPEQMTGWGWQSVHDPEVLPAVIERWRASIDTGRPFEMTFPLRGADGVFRSFLTRAVPAGNQQGRVERWFGTCTDVEAERAATTERERMLADAEAARVAAERERRRLETLLESLPVGVTLADATSGRVLMSNTAVRRIWGTDEPTARAADDSASYLTYDRETGRRVAGNEWPLERAITKGEVVTDELVDIERPDGSRVLLSVSAAPVREADGQIVGGVIVSLDVTEREGALAALVATEQRARTVAENATLALFVMDAHQRCSYMNPAAERLTGYTFAELQGNALHHYLHHTHPDGRPYPLEECPIDQAFPTRMREQGTEVFVHKDGTFYPVAFTASPIRDAVTETTVGTILEVRAIADELAAAAERERLLAAEQTARQRTEMLQTVTAALSAARTPAEVARVASQAGVRGAGFPRCGIAFLDADEATFTLAATEGYAPEALAGWERYPNAPGLPVHEAVTTRAPVTVVGDEFRARFPAAAAWAAAYGVAGHAVLPLVAAPGPGDVPDGTHGGGSGRVLGVMSFALTEPRTLLATEVHFLGAVAALTATALERALAFEAESAARRRAEALQAATAALVRLHTPHEIGDLVAQQLIDALGADMCWIGWLAPDGSMLETIGAAGVSADELGLWRRFPAKAGVPLADALRDGPAQWWSDRACLIAAYPGYAATAHALDREGAAIIPLIVGEGADARPVGKISVGYRAPHRFADDERALILTVSRLCAHTLERARLLEEERAARQTAEEQSARADAANQSKGIFLANMSHELRTPLNAIAGYVQLLDMGLHGAVTDAQREVLGRVARAERRLLTLVNDVLNYAKLESGTVAYDVQPVELGEVVAEVAPLLEPQMADKGLAFDLPKFEAPCLVWADRDKLGQVLVNLLSNAVKFTAAHHPVTGVPGRVSISVAMPAAESPVAPNAPPADTVDLPELPEIPATALVYVRVTDTGVGIPRERHEAVFEPFVQVRSGYASSTAGAGLGLTISRDLSRGMGGDLRMRSAPDEGSTFTLVLRRVMERAGTLIEQRTNDASRNEA